MASFLLKINCILPVLKTKKTLFTHFQQCVLSFNSWSMLLKSKDNTVVAKQQSAEMLNIYKVLFLLNLQTALHTPLVDTRSSWRSTVDIAEIPALSWQRADALWQLQPSPASQTRSGGPRDSEPVHQVSAAAARRQEETAGLKHHWHEAPWLTLVSSWHLVISSKNSEWVPTI